MEYSLEVFNMKKSLKVSVIILALTMALWLVSIAISFGDNLGVFAWPLYLGTIFCATYFVVLPIVRYYRMSSPIVELPLSKDREFEARDIGEYEIVIKNMSKTFEDNESREALASIETKYDIIGSARKLVSHRLDEVDKTIVKSAFLVLATSTISQSSKIDGLTVLFYNLKLIRDIGVLLGFRPNKLCVFKLYVSVFFSALVAYNIDDLFDSLMPEEVVSNVAGGIASGLGGLSNAILTMRIGYIAKLYICSPREFDSRSARKSATCFIRGNLTSIIKKGKDILNMENLFRIFKKEY